MNSIVESTQKLLGRFLEDYVDSETIQKICSIYVSNKEDFLEGFERFLNSFIDTEFASNLLYKTYLNVKYIQSDREELQDSILELIVNLFFKNKSANLAYFLKQSNELSKTILSIFLSKLIQFNYDSFIIHCRNFSEISGTSLVKVVLAYFEKNNHKFNLFFEQFDNDLKVQILEATFRDFNYSSYLIEEYLTHDLSFKNKVIDSLYDGSSLVDAFINIRYSTYRAYPKFLNLIIQNVARLPNAFQKMIDTAQETQNYSVLISLAQPGYKRQILRILTNHGTESLINEFISLFKDDPEVKALMAFI